MKPKTPCRQMETRNCPISGCEGLPCARFETEMEDESRWALDEVEWEKDRRRRASA